MNPNVRTPLVITDALLSPTDFVTGDKLNLLDLLELSGQFPLVISSFMSTGATAKPPPSKSRKDRERDREKKDKASQPAGATERLKTVVRRLPPNLPEDVFWQSVQNWVTDDTATWKVFYPGKIRKRYT